MATAIILKPSERFVETPFIRDIVNRALSYLKAGFPINLAGPAGCGKTTLAFHIAWKLGKPVTLIVGNDEVKSSNLIGGELGYSRRLIYDRFISSVLKVEESAYKVWLDERLLAACKYGYTLIYDEFTRVKPEVNNVLLPIFEDKMIFSLPASSGGGYIRVHPDFRAILTSNPEEYAGVYRAQDALLDRLVTIHLNGFDEETEVRITMAKASVPYEDAKRIVGIVRRLRETGLCEYTPTVRSCIMIAKLMKQCGADLNSKKFREICHDVLAPKIGKGKIGKVSIDTLLEEVLNKEVSVN
ncbi:MAG: gas vesicle protein GvpN [Candidatus Bathyarchaeota archaeon]|nr:gas vesicle protein GvpN [Candidatus Bathyarchaeota archaeon]